MTARLLTASGLLVDPTNPTPAIIRIEDIAHALARIPRFNGHTALCTSAYSVAQHCLMVSEAVPKDLALVGLMHDAAEAYLGDLATPVKVLLPFFAELERRWALAIGEAFGLGDRLADLPPAVQEADARALATERRDLMAPNGGWVPGAQPYGMTLDPLDAPHATDAFMAHFDLLMGGT